MTPTPRVFVYPEEPTNVHRLEVIVDPSITFVPRNGVWMCEQDNCSYTWDSLQTLYRGGYREVGPSEYELALEYFRTGGVPDTSPLASEWMYARTIVLHALGE